MGVCQGTGSAGAYSLERNRGGYDQLGNYMTMVNKKVLLYGEVNKTETYNRTTEQISLPMLVMDTALAARNGTFERCIVSHEHVTPEGKTFKFNAVMLSMGEFRQLTRRDDED